VLLGLQSSLMRLKVFTAQMDCRRHLDEVGLGTKWPPMFFAVMNVSRYVCV
jgi:hypothetical protein